MEKKLEREFILLAVLQMHTVKEKNRLDELLHTELDWGWIAGQCMNHRLSGYLYYGLGDLLHNSMNSEYLNALTLIVAAQEIVARERYKEITKVFSEFENNHIHYAALKGLVYGMTMYPYGIRKSGDCDILVLEDDLKKVDDILSEIGYLQSTDKGKTKASKRSVLIQRMNYHDTVPYYKQIESKLHPRVKLDINFHVDQKDNDITKKVLDYGTTIIEKGEFFIRALDIRMQFLHLCIHFYREGSNMLWTANRRDVSLYKIVDIMNTYQSMSEVEFKEAIQLAENLNISKHVFYTLYYLNMFYPRKTFKQTMKCLGMENEKFLFQIKVEGEGDSTYVVRKESFIERAFHLTLTAKK